MNRREVLKAIGALTAFMSAPRLALGQAILPETFANINFNLNETRTIAIVGAGVAGLAAAYVAARAGFRVIVFESTDRYGGRSLTLRPDDAQYKDWWFEKYNPTRLFPKMYATSYQERDDSPDSVQQPQNIAGGQGGFAVEKWPGSDEFVELYLNAGPGRIPSNHSALINLCGEIGVRLEPYIFVSASNLLYSRTYAQGEPVQWREVNYSLLGQLAEIVSEAVKDGMILRGYEREQVLSMLRKFGDLSVEGTFTGSSTVGYLREPAGWLTPLTENQPINLQDILDSGFIGGGDAEQTAGSFISNPNRITWQPSLMQPVGGMDRIWQQLLLQEIPRSAIDYPADGGIPAPDLTNRGGDTGKVYVGDLVRLSTPITSISGANGDTARVGTPDGEVQVDAVIVTVAPALLSGINSAPTGITQSSVDTSTNIPESVKSDYDFTRINFPQYMLIENDLPSYFKEALGSVNMTPANKVGTQGIDRFWERNDGIYGGISWTTHLSSQIWYPSEDFNAPTGILTAAYNRGLEAYYFAMLSQTERRDEAILGGESLHHNYKHYIAPEFMPTIAWQYMPGQIAGWASKTYVQQCDVYSQITSVPIGCIFFAGDTYSQTPGWQVGAIDSARLAVRAFSEGLHSSDPALYGSDEVLTCL